MTPDDDGGGGSEGDSPLRVIFFDGQQESDIGDVVVSRDTDFRTFQAIMSQKIGLSPHQFTVYVKKGNSNRKIPVTGKANFSAILREKGTHFFVVLKRTKRERRKKNYKEDHDEKFYYEYVSSFRKNPPADAKLLRRGMGIDAVSINNQIYPGVISPLNWEYEKRVKSLKTLQIEREKYLMNMGLRNLDLVEREETIAEGVKNQRENTYGAVCEECSRAKETGREAGFHWCVHDAVTQQFRSPAGPIARPVKGSD